MRVPLDPFLAKVPVTDADGIPLIIVGGQCANFWAGFYADRAPKISALHPFTSEDIDFLGNAEDAKSAAKRAGKEAQLATMDDGGAIAGYYTVALDGHEHRVDFLNFLVNLSEDEAETGSVKMNYRGRVLRFLTPPALLQTKIGCLASLPQEVRQDEKHLRIALLASRCYFEDMIQNLREGKFEERAVINSIKKVERLTQGRLSKMAESKATSPVSWKDFLPTIEQAEGLEKLTAYLKSTWAKPRFSEPLPTIPQIGDLPIGDDGFGGGGRGGK
jgi:hypothetical protein